MPMTMGQVAVSGSNAGCAEAIADPELAAEFDNMAA